MRVGLGVGFRFGGRLRVGVRGLGLGLRVGFR